MINFFERVLQQPEHCRQFACGDSLITAFNCPLEGRIANTRFFDLWSRHNYIFYVIDGKKTWHTVHGSYELVKGSCVFVRKGGSIIEQFFDAGFCLMLFFIPDEFLCATLKTKSTPISKPVKHFEPVILLHATESLEAFFISMYSYFSDTREPDQSLLELKFRELILTLADNPKNSELIAYFCTLLQEPQSAQLRRVMEDNFCYNLRLEQYALLCNRSLSAFKRDFQKQFGKTPGKWLLEKRLHHARHLLRTMNKTVSEAAFESGFENPSHFSRSFRDRFGLPPTAERLQLPG